MPRGAEPKGGPRGIRPGARRSSRLPPGGGRGRPPRRPRRGGLRDRARPRERPPRDRRPDGL